MSVATQLPESPRLLAWNRLEELLLASIEGKSIPSIAFPQDYLATTLGVTSKTIQRAGQNLVQSGRWAVTSGSGRSETTYRYLFRQKTA